MDFRKQFVVEPGSLVRLAEIDTGFVGDFADKEAARIQTEKNTAKLAELQYKLYAENRRSLLIILQAMDAGGKDGTINKVFAPMNPQGCRVQGFKEPSREALAHDFLWRIHLFTPKAGEVVVFNRSHYEDVLIVRVHDLVPKTVWSKRYEHIRNFEKMLTDHQTKVVKFFLHISPEEQLKRFMERLDDPAKQWKISEADYRERERWGDYAAAFEDAFRECSTPEAPWYIIPADHKHFRNLAVSQIMVDVLEEMKLEIPKPTVDLDEIRAAARAAQKKKLT
jgi:PPK2 family polyphosphate:nucleotide phosphotransferase